MMKLIRPNTNLDFVGKIKFCAVASGVLVLLSLVVFGLRGRDNLGIEFTGGVLQQVKFDRPTEVGDLHKALKQEGIEGMPIQEIQGVDPVFIVRSSLEQKGFVRKALENVHGAEHLSVDREEMVGATVGKDLRKQGMWAIFLSLLAILGYVTWRFELRYAVGAILALFHDIAITMGVLALCHVEFTLQILAALLTILGYSINDTIVLFDRIREILKVNKKDSIKKIVNMGVNQTLSRTILTALTVFIVVLMLFVFGGAVNRDFALAMLVGVVAGTYSSVYIASSTLVYWHLLKRTPSKK